MFYTVYKITNLLNNKHYIGKHMTKDLDDGYMGSGKLIRHEIKKHGKENFKKEILHVFDNEEAMNAKEAELVVVSEETYNLCDGGKGGFGYINSTGKNLYGKNGQSGFGKENLVDGNRQKEMLKAQNKFVQYCDNMSTIKKEFYQKNNHPWLGRKHSIESKIKMSASSKGKQSGEQNSQYGTCWINDGQTNKKIKKEVLDIWLANGYNKGRIV